MKRILTLSALALALFAGAAASAAPIVIDVPNVEPVQSQLTQAEVLADFQIWRLAGLGDLTRGEQSVDTNSYQYRRAYATYLALRDSPQYAELVNELQQRPFASVVASRRPSNPFAQLMK
ncbi:MAG: hypothetical protein JWQ76_5253 [Ramlibacter sp.]|nr:hypothetical protein [Ramlibacter sp.]